MNHLRTLLVCTTLVSFIQAFPDGARNNGSNPMESISSHCTSGNFRPHHDNYMPKSDTAPYVIKVTSPSGQIYRHGQIVTITIQGNQRTPFKGFFMQGDSSEASFSGEMKCTNGKQTHYCGKAGVTHAHRLPKNSIECTWSPPDHQIGNVQFVATIVKDKATFWTGVKSDVILQPDPTAMTYEQKAAQMRQQMMRQFQQGGAGFRNMMGQQSGANPFGNMMKLFSGASNGGQERSSNPFAALLQQSQGGGQNPFAGLLNRQG